MTENEREKRLGRTVVALRNARRKHLPIATSSSRRREIVEFRDVQLPAWGSCCAYAAVVAAVARPERSRPHPTENGSPEEKTRMRVGACLIISDHSALAPTPKQAIRRHCGTPETSLSEFRGGKTHSDSAALQSPRLRTTEQG
jgi:hypothetical protein